MEDNMMTMEETTTTTEVTPVNTEVYPTETSSGGSTLAKIAIVGVIGALSGAAAFGVKKLKARNEKKTIEKLKKEGWVIVEPEPEAEFEEEEPVSEDDIPEEESKE